MKFTSNETRNVMGDFDTSKRWLLNGYCANDVMRYVTNAEDSRVLDAKRALIKKKKAEVTPKKIIAQGPATIVFWEDGTKTIVKKSERDGYDVYAAFCAALAKKLYGSNSAVKKLVNKKIICKG